MAVPDARFEFQIGGTWTDVTDHARSGGGGASHDRGRPENSARVDSSRASLTVESPAGLYSNRNPRSPYYGLLGRNTGVRATVAGPTYLTAPNPNTTTAAATTPDVPALDVTGDLDIRMDLSPTSWTTAETVDLVAKHESVGDQRSWIVFVSGGRPILRWSSAGTSATIKDAFATAPIIDRPYGRRALRITLDVNNGAGGHTVTFYTAPTIAGPWTQLGDAVTGAGTTSVFASSAPIELGNLNDIASPAMPGKWHGFQLRNGINGPAVADVDFTAQTPGASGFTDTAGRVWSVTAAGSLLNRWPRFNLFVAEWPTSWHPSGHNVTASLRASGMLRRLEQGAKPIGSALRRYIAASTAVECWPLTDGAEATQAASLMDGPPMVYSRQADDDPPSWAQGRVADWIEPVVKLPGGGKLIGNLPYQSSMNEGWAVDHVRSGPGEVDQIHMHDWGAGTDEQNRHVFQLFFQGPLDRILVLREAVGRSSSSGASLATISSAGIFDDRPHHIRFQVWQAGSTLFWWVYLDGVERATGSLALTVKPLRRVEYWWGTSSQNLALGYITCWPQSPPMPTAAESYQALMGWAGEDALSRVERLCAEESIPCVTSGGHAEATPMGAQHVDTLVNLLGQCEESDGGVLYEDHVTGGLAYRTRAAHTNQAPRMTIPYAMLAPPLTPVDDDLGPYPLENDVTVDRIGGSSARTVVTDGPMSPDAVGLYNVAVSQSLANDAQPAQQAGWRMHLHTWDEARYPAVRLYLHKHPELIGDVLGLDVGDVIRITDLPDFLPPGPLDLMVMGHKDQLGPFLWDLILFCHPAGPWNVFQLDGGEYGRLDTAGSELAAAVDADDTTLTVATTNGPIWADSATYPGDFPFDVRAGGEVMTVTAITPSVTDVFGRTVAAGWGTADVGGTWLLDGGVAADYAVSGGVGTVTHPDINTARRTYLPAPSPNVDLHVDIATAALATGGSLFAMPTARTAHNSSLYMARLEFTTAQTIILTIRKRVPTESQLGSSYTTTLTHTAGTFYRVRLQTSGTALRAKVWPATAPEPGVWHVETTDADLTAAANVGTRSYRATGNTNASAQFRFDNFRISNPQTFTVTRAVNGIAKSHTAGTDLELAHPTVIAL